MNNSNNILEDRTNTSGPSNDGPRFEPVGTDSVSKSLLRRIRNYKRVRVKASAVRTPK